MDADREAGSQPQLRTLGDPDHIAAGAQRVENAPLPDPFQVFWRACPTQDRQPPQLVGFVAGRGVGQHVRVRVLDADHSARAVGDRLRETEQVGAGVIQRVAAVAMVFEGMVDQLVEQLPPRPRFDRHNRDAECGRTLDRGGGRLLDENGSGDAPDVLPDPVHRLGVRYAEQEEQIRRTGADREPEPHVVRVYERNRTHRHVQPAGRLDQRHHRAIEGEQKLPETQPGCLHRHTALLCPIRL